MLQVCLSSLVLLLAVVDPFGGFPAYVALLKNVAPARRRIVILREVGIALLVLLLAMAFGRGFLRVLQISEASVGIAGGVVLFMIALRMIFPHREGVNEAVDAEPFIVPLAIPLLAGPSALAMVLLLVARTPQFWPMHVLALVVTMAVCAGVLFFVDHLHRFFGAALSKAFERLMGLILTAIAVEMLMTGIRAFILQMQAG